MNIYIVEGGVGKQVAFTALLPLLAEKDKSKVLIHSPYPDIFLNNSYVEQVFDSTKIQITDHAILNQADNIIFVEPYKSNFKKGHQHLLESYCELLHLPYSKNLLPQLNTDHLKEEAENTLKALEVPSRFIVLQTSGGQPPINVKPDTRYEEFDRSYLYPRWYHPEYVQNFIEITKEKYPSLDILHFSLPNEPTYHGTKRLDVHYCVCHEILKKAQTFVGIDSSLNHLSASARKSGVVIWGSTKWSQFGYSHNRNVNFFGVDTWDDALMNCKDPRISMVHPYRVFQLMESFL